MTDLPYYDDCNESELFSRESFTENWTGSTESFFYGEEVRKEIEELMDQRESISKNVDYVVEGSFEFDNKLEDNDLIPYFEHWTLYDKVQRRAYVTFKTNEDLRKALDSDDFNALWNRIAIDRKLAFTSKELSSISHFSYYPWEVELKDTVSFLCKDTEYYPLDWSHTKNDVYFDVAVPTGWQIRDVRRSARFASINKLPLMIKESDSEEDVYPF